MKKNEMEKRLGLGENMWKFRPIAKNRKQITKQSKDKFNQ